MAKCMWCRKSLLKCNCYSDNSGTAKKRSTGGGRPVRDTVRGNTQWCGACSCRVMNGRCTNVQCSTNKK